MNKMYRLWLVHKETCKKEVKTFEAGSLVLAVELWRNRYDYHCEYDIIQVKEIKNEKV